MDVKNLKRISKWLGMQRRRMSTPRGDRLFIKCTNHSYQTTHKAVPYLITNMYSTFMKMDTHTTPFKLIHHKGVVLGGYLVLHVHQF